MSARLDPATEKAIAKIEALRAQLDADKRVIEIRLEAIDEAIAILRQGRRKETYDTVPIADVVEEPRVEAVTTPAPEATPTRATMRPPAPAFTPRAVGRKPGLNGGQPQDGPAAAQPDRPSIRTRVLTHVAAHGPVTQRALAEGIEAHRPSVQSICSVLVKEKKIERHFAADGSEIGYAVPGWKPAPAASSSDAPPVAQPRKVNGTAPVELTGALKIIARDVLKALQIGPATEIELFQKTAWPVGSIRTVVATLKAEGKVSGSDKIRLAEARE